MSLFSDTIRDARRPISGGWVRRAAADEAAPEPMEEELPPESSGMQTVFRFQKEGQVLPREASFQFGGGKNRLPAGDPLSAGTEVERPEPPATNVQVTGISVQGDNRGSELATGQEEHGSPSKVAAANVKSESKTHQSAGLPGPIEAEWVREQQSNTPEGGEQLVSGQSETFLSRPSGRGAPSETSLTETSPHRITRDLPEGWAEKSVVSADVHDHSEVVPSAPVPLMEPLPFGIPGGEGRRAPATASPGRPVGPAAEAATFALANTPDSPSPSARGGRPLFTPPTPMTHAASRAPEPAQPSLVIGRIDVVVVASDAPPQTQPTQPAARAERGFLSRNYLKRL